MTKSSNMGGYVFRRRIPLDVRMLLGGGPTHVKRSLRTRDPKKAPALFKEMEAKYEAAWAQVRMGIQDIDARQAAGLAGEFYRDMLVKWPMRNNVAMLSWGLIKFNCERFDEEFEGGYDGRQAYFDGLITLHGQRLGDFLIDRGISVSPRGWQFLLEATHRAVKLGIEQMYKETANDWSPDRPEEKFPPLQLNVPPNPDHQFEFVWEMWILDAKPKDSTVRRWKPILTKMFATLGTTDLSEVTEKMLIRWTKGLLASGLHNNTVAKVYLAVAKRLFGFAKQQEYIRFDPSRDVRVSNGKKYATEMRQFEDHEAAIVLRATLEPPSERMSPAFAAARRWVPWICAYTGARVNEITQARACDFKMVKGMAVLSISDEFGTVKTGPRVVPLHQDLADQGFLDFLATKHGDEPLFFALREGDTPIISPYEEMGARLGKWVRGLGLTDKSLDPNHGWRHRFKGYAAKAGIQERVVDALQGHAPTTQGRKYGKVDLVERIAAIRKLPRIALEELEAAIPMAAE